MAEETLGSHVLHCLMVNAIVLKKEGCRRRPFPVSRRLFIYHPIKIWRDRAGRHDLFAI